LCQREESQNSRKSISLAASDVELEDETIRKRNAFGAKINHNLIDSCGLPTDH